MTSDQSPGQPAAEKDTSRTAGDADRPDDGAGATAAPAQPADEASSKPAPARRADPKAAKSGGRTGKSDEVGKPGKSGKSDKGEKAKAAAKAVPALVRTRVAQAVWILCVLAAAFLALGALVIALDFNQQNAAVEFVLNGADQVDLGVFTRDEGIKQFTGENADTKNALVNYGVGALFWIVVGRIADRFIRP